MYVVKTAAKIQLKYLLISLLFLLPLDLHNVYAQEETYTQHPTLDYIAIDNEVVTSDNNLVTVDRQDTVKVAGIGEPNSSIKVEFDNQIFDTTVDQYGNWFVLFSVQDLENGNHPVEIQTDSSTEKDILLTLALGDNSTATANNNTEQFKINNLYVFAGSLLLVLLILSIFILSNYKKKSTNEKSQDQGK